MSNRVLIVDDVAVNRMVLKVRLTSAAYEVTVANDLDQAQDATAGQEFRLVILGERTGGAAAAAEFCRALAARPGSPPVMVIGSGRTPAEEQAARLAALTAGAADFMARPLDEASFLARVRSLMRLHARHPATVAAGAEPGRSREGCGTRAGLASAAGSEPGFAEALAGYALGTGTAPPQIAIVSPDGREALAWRRELRKWMAARIFTLASGGLFDALRNGPLPDAIVISAGAGRLAELRLIAEIKARSETADLPLIVVGGSEPEFAIMALDLGAGDVLAHGFDAEELALRLRQRLAQKRDDDHHRSQLAEELRLASTDALTGLPNRRAAFQGLANLRDQALVSRRPYAVMVVDVDRFKRVNDRWGHAAGDRVLSGVAQRMAAALGPGDLVGRIGGEEFLVALPDASLGSARKTAERIRRAIEAAPVRLSAGAEVWVTLSIGLCLSDGTEPVDIACERADRALFDAKARGRNKVQVHRPAA